MQVEPVGSAHFLAHTQERKGSCLNKNSPGQVPSNLQFSEVLSPNILSLILTPVLRKRDCPFYIRGD